MASETDDPAAKARRVLDANPLVQAAMALSEIGYDRDVALAEVAHLRAENAALREIAREIAQAVADGRLRGGSREEVWCCTNRYTGFTGHYDDCPVAQAFDLLADTPTTRLDATQRNGNE